VVAKREAERVKELVEQLKARNRNEALEGNTIISGALASAVLTGMHQTSCRGRGFP
jgi:hypothetical protein